MSGDEMGRDMVESMKKFAECEHTRWKCVNCGCVSSQAIGHKMLMQMVEHWAKEAGCTCHDCPAKWTCEFAWDGYNTEGDCLNNK